MNHTYIFKFWQNAISKIAIVYSQIRLWTFTFQQVTAGRPYFKDLFLILKTWSTAYLSAKQIRYRRGAPIKINNTFKLFNLIHTARVNLITLLNLKPTTKIINFIIRSFYKQKNITLFLNKKFLIKFLLTNAIFFLNKITWIHLNHKYIYLKPINLWNIYLARYSYSAYLKADDILRSRPPCPLLLTDSHKFFEIDYFSFSTVYITSFTQLASYTILLTHLKWSFINFYNWKQLY